MGAVKVDGRPGPTSRVTSPVLLDAQMLGRAPGTRLDRRRPRTARLAALVPAVRRGREEPAAGGPDRVRLPAGDAGAGQDRAPPGHDAGAAGRAGSVELLPGPLERRAGHAQRLTHGRWPGRSAREWSRRSAPGRAEPAGTTRLTARARQRVADFVEEEGMRWTGARPSRSSPPLPRGQRIEKRSGSGPATRQPPHDPALTGHATPAAASYPSVTYKFDARPTTLPPFGGKKYDHSLLSASTSIRHRRRTELRTSAADLPEATIRCTRPSSG